MGQIFASIDLSPTRARLALMEASLRAAQLSHLETFELQDGETTEEMLTRVRASLPSDLDSIVVSCDPSATSARRLEFPFTDLRKLEPAIDFELEGQIPYDLEELATSWAISERSKTHTSVLSALTPRENLLERISLLATADLEPRAVVLPAATLAELLPVSSEDVQGVLCVGETLSHLTLVQKGQVRFLRSMRAGGADIDRVLAKEFKIDLEQAKTAKETEARVFANHEYQTDNQKAISDSVRQGLKNLISNLVSTLRAIPEEQQPTRLLLTGGTSRLPGLPDLLSQVLGIEVEILDIPACLKPCTAKVESIGPEYAVVVSMALALLRRGRAIPLNLRRGELAYKGDLQLYRGQLTRLAIGAAAVFLLAIIAATVRYSVISSQDKQLNQSFCDATQRIVGREICDPTAALATMRQSPGASEGLVLPTYSASTVLEMMSKVVTKELDVGFEDMEIRLDSRPGETDRISAKGDAASFETTEQLIAVLKRDPCVQDAEIAKQQKARNSSRVEFSLNVFLQCPPGAIPGASTPMAKNAAEGE